MKKMKNNSPLHPICPDKKLTNHSTRKTLAKKLQKNVIQSTELISITGLHYSPLQPCKLLPESNTATVSHIRLFTPSTLPSNLHLLPQNQVLLLSPAVKDQAQFKVGHILELFKFLPCNVKHKTQLHSTSTTDL